MSDRLVFEGESFAVADKVGLMALMRFAHVAKRGVDSDELAGLAAMYDLLAQVIAPEDWDRFQDHALAVHADGDTLMGVIPAAIEIISGRPTLRPSDSSDGSQTTNGNSAGDSSSQVITRLESVGRPDLALMVAQAQESKRSA